MAEHRDENYGSSNYLDVDGPSDGEAAASYVRFKISGVSGTIRRAIVRVFSTNNHTSNGPAIYTTNSMWNESEITWNTQPELTSDTIDNKAAISSHTWAEYDVTAVVSGNGTHSFALIADSGDGVIFSSREGSAPPQLLLIVSH